MSSYGCTKEVCTTSKKPTETPSIFIVVQVIVAEMYPDFQIMGSSGPLLEKFGGPLLSFGGPANL